MAGETHGSTQVLTRRIVENFPGGAIYVLNRRLRFLLACGRELEQAGLDSSALVGKTIRQALPASVAREFVPRCNEALAGHSVEFEHDVNGETYLMVVIPLDFKRKLVTRILLVSRNITRLRRAEDENKLLLENTQRLADREQYLRLRAEAAETRFRAVFDATADAIVVADSAGNYLDVNMAACKMLGYSREEFLSMNVSQIVANPAVARDEYERFLSAGQWRGEIDLVHSSGAIIPTEVNAAALPMPDGMMYISALRDITQRRELETMQKEFLSEVAHELRNPLTPIIGFARILKRRRMFDESAVDDIEHYGRLLEHLLDDLLETTRVDLGQVRLNREQSDLVKLVRNSVRQIEILHAEYLVTLNLPTDPVTGWWDSQRIEQVLTNLLSNSVKYSPAGSEISVKVEANSQEATVFVSDQGIGIAEEALPLLFNRFTRSDDARSKNVKGFGLGLYVARALVEAHGGRISASSGGLGKGATIAFTLPRQDL